MKAIRKVMLIGLLEAALLPASVGQAQTNLIDQAYGAGAGSFELGFYDTNSINAYHNTIVSTNALIGAWVWTLNSVSPITGWICTSNVNWNWGRWQDADGTKDVELGAGGQHSSIYTTLNLNGGTTYILSFALSTTAYYVWNPGIIQVTFGTAIQSFTNSASTSATNMQWLTNSLTFTPATTGSYLLQFYHAVSADVPVIDAVSVVASNPVAPPPLVRTSVSGSPVLVWLASATGYSLQMNTNPPSGTWNTVSNGVAFTGLQVTNAPGNAFFRLH